MEWTSVSIGKFPQTISWAAVFPASPSLSYALVILLIVKLSTGMQNSTLPMDQGRQYFGYQCEDNPKCLCTVVYKGASFRRKTMACEEKIYFDMTTWSIDMKCDGENLDDPYKYLSVPQDLMPWYGSMKITRCPPPPQGYSTIINSGEGNQSVHQMPNAIEQLHINCEGFENFHLESSHFNGMKRLKLLVVNCPTLSNMSSDLLSDISGGEVEFIKFTETSIENIPDETFAGFYRVDTLIFSQSKLKLIKKSLFTDLKALETLHLHRNRIDLIEDDAFMSTTKIKELSLFENQISKIPSSLCRLRMLKTLFANENRITYIPQECLTGLVSLTDVEFSRNQLISLHAALNAPKSTSTIYTNETLQNVFPDNSPETSSNGTKILEHSAGNENKLFGSVEISFLKLEYNNLTSLTRDTFFGLHRIRTLDISSNRITQLHQDTFVQNSELISLNLSNNHLTHLPEILLRNNSKLDELYISGNRIRSLGLSFFSNLMNLAEVSLRNNRIHSLPPEIFKPFEAKEGVTEYTKLKLHLDGNLLPDIPVLTIPGLVQLNIARNRLTQVDADAFKHTPKLEILDLSDNLITSLGGPPESPGGQWPNSRQLFSGNLKNLKSVDLSGNKLGSVPDLGLVVNSLKSLNLSGNHIPGSQSQLFPEVMGTSNLEILDLSRNGFSFPNDTVRTWYISVVRVLKYLYLSGNQMRLPKCLETFDDKRRVWGCASIFSELQTLEVLIISHNDIDFVPMEFQYYMPRLLEVDLSHNKISTLWYHDFLVTTGVGNYEIIKLYDSESRCMQTIGEGKNSFLEFHKNHHLTIDLRNNIIESVILPNDKVETVLQDCHVEKKFAQATILLGGNPLNCDCNIFNLLQYSLKEIRPISIKERYERNTLTLPAVIDIQGLHCLKPETIKGKAVSETETWAHHLLPLAGLCQDQLGSSQKKEGIPTPFPEREEEGSTSS